MSLYHHVLSGCAATPLAHYLKGLGILRLVSEQADPSSRGFWRGGGFHLITCLSADDLEAFFLDTYAPTPIVAPWNGGSGFYPKDNRSGLGPIAASTGTRFEAYRQAIRDGMQLVGTASEAAKGEAKAQLIAALRRRWRGGCLEMLDAAVVLSESGDPKYPSLFGTGWNDGRLDFSNNFMQRVAELFLGAGGTPDWARPLLTACLVRDPRPGLLTGKSVGQFMPGSAGGANGSTGPDAASILNPWDFILMLEGAVLFVATLTRRTARESTQASAPFATYPAPAGYATASRAEAGERGEQWMPLWEAPASLAEVRRLFAEGRVQLQRSPATRPLDFARAVARLGVARGIVAFTRFGYLERNGQAKLAVPLGRWEVASQPNQQLLDDLDCSGWMDHLQRVAHADLAPASLAMAHRRIEEAVMAVCARGGEPNRWQTLLIALGDCEAQMVRSGKFAAEKGVQPIPPLSAAWLGAADDGSPEFRLALALALQAADGSGTDGIRRHWLPLDARGMRFARGEAGFARDPGVVCCGLDPERDLIALVQRRLIEGEGSPLLVAARSAPARMADLSALLGGSVDLIRTVSLARPLMALNRRDPDLGSMLGAVVRPAWADPPAPFALLRLVFLAEPLRLGAGEVAVRCDPAVFNRLASGDISAAGEMAIRRLRGVGLIPRLRRIAGDTTVARLMAAAMAFPVCGTDAMRLAERLTKNTQPE